MLGTEPHPLIGAHQGSKHRDQSHFIRTMLIKHLDPAQIVQAERRQAGLFFQLARGCGGRLLGGLDVPVNGFPGAGASPAGSPSEHQALE